MTGPPPPPPPPPPPAPETSTNGASGEDTASALFAEINSLGAKGVRAGLKKATRGPVNTTAPQENKDIEKVTKKVNKVSIAKSEPKTELCGKKWMVEYHNDNKEISVEVTSMKHSVYVYKCEKSVIQVKGKVNSISIDSCKKVDLVFEDALSQIEIVNSDSVRVQATGAAPSINIDGCNGVTYYMTKESVDNCMVITSKSAAVNLIRPKDDDPDDIVESYIPEQFMTTFRDGDFVTKAVEHDD